jgi:hypothetical protein
LSSILGSPAAPSDFGGELPGRSVCPGGRLVLVTGTLPNLAEALPQVFTTQSQALDAANDAVRQQPVALPDGAVAVPVPPLGQKTTWGLR